MCVSAIVNWYPGPLFLLDVLEHYSVREHIFQSIWIICSNSTITCFYVLWALWGFVFICFYIPFYSFENYLRKDQKKNKLCMFYCQNLARVSSQVLKVVVLILKLIFSIFNSCYKWNIYHALISLYLGIVIEI